MIDDFITHADENLDGYLNFVEYTSAIRQKDQQMNAPNEDYEPLANNLV